MNWFQDRSPQLIDSYVNVSHHQPQKKEGGRKKNGKKKKHLKLFHLSLTFSSLDSPLDFSLQLLCTPNLLQFLGAHEKPIWHSVEFLRVMDLMSSCNFSKVRDVGDGAHREPPVDEPVVDEHVRDAEQRNPQALSDSDTCT